MHFTSGNVIVRCAQTGQKKITKLEALGRADQMPICETDCVDGAELLITEHGQEYPVTFVSFSGVMMHWYWFGCSIHILYCYSDKGKKSRISHQQYLLKPHPLQLLHHVHRLLLPLEPP